MSWVTPVKKVLKRSFDDWNEASALFETPGAPNPYFFVTPEVVRSDLNKPDYRSYFQMPVRKKMKMTVVRRRRGRRVVRKRTIGRRRRSNWKVRARRQIGKPLQQKAAVKTALSSESLNFAMNNNTLYSFDLDRIPLQGTGKNQRDSDRVNIRGIRTMVSFCNSLGGSTGPTGLPNMIHVNFAWIGLKREDANNLELDFFRSDADQRGSGFANAPPIFSKYQAINTDKFVVLKHKRISLNPHLAGIPGYSYTRKFWMPIKRQVVFEAPTDVQPQEGRMLFVCWAIGAFYNGGTTQADICRLSIRNVLFFTDDN